MKTSLDLKQLVIPFRRTFRHASAARSATESVWVEVRTRSGAVGYGEGCPRGYVTGEDVSSVARFFEEHRASLCARIVELDDLIAWADAHRAAIDRNPAAWCAIELAWLDALARERGVSVEKLLGLDEIDGRFRYSAVIGVETDEAFRATLRLYAAAGFRDFKLKLSGNTNRDRAQLEWFQAHAPSEWRLRVDANNLWATPGEAMAAIERLDCPFMAIEEPLRPARRYKDLATLAATTGCRIILDESCLRAEEVAMLPCTETQRAPWVINVRVSKMGGLLRSRAVVDAARRHGLPIVVGAQVGETSLLTRAALTMVGCARGMLLAHEGAFGTLLLQADVCDPPLTFEVGGRLDWKTPAEVGGWGLQMRSNASFLRPL